MLYGFVAVVKERNTALTKMLCGKCCRRICRGRDRQKKERGVHLRLCCGRKAASKQLRCLTSKPKEKKKKKEKKVVNFVTRTGEETAFLRLLFALDIDLS